MLTARLPEDLTRVPSGFEPLFFFRSSPLIVLITCDDGAAANIAADADAAVAADDDRHTSILRVLQNAAQFARKLGVLSQQIFQLNPQLRLCVFVFRRGNYLFDGFLQ